MYRVSSCLCNVNKIVQKKRIFKTENQLRRVKGMKNEIFLACSEQEAGRWISTRLSRV